VNVIVATKADGGEAAFVVSDPPTATDLDRWRDLIEASPALAGATWTAHEGESSR